MARWRLEDGRWRDDHGGQRGTAAAAAVAAATAVTQRCERLKGVGWRRHGQICLRPWAEYLDDEELELTAEMEERAGKFGNLTAEFDLQAEARDDELTAEIKEHAGNIRNLTAEFDLQAEARD